MRELKFRVWDTNRECYLDETELAGITSDGKYILYAEENEISKLEIKGDYIVEFDTGLKDKNGKEIYKGDIVSVLTQYYTDTFKIAWREDKAGWFGFATDDYNLPLCNIRHAEVMGNVHENAYLLGGEDEQ